MLYSALVLRIRRKQQADGSLAVASEALTKALENDSVRSIINRLVTDHGSVLDQSRLKDVAGRHWDVDTENVMNPLNEEVALPRKTRLPRRGSFDGLDVFHPTNPFVAELTDATILGPSGLAVTETSQFVKDTVNSVHSSDSRIEKILARSIRHNGYRTTRDAVRHPGAHVDRQLDRATPLVPLWNNYYHWTLECLPRLIGIETYRRETGKHPIVLIPRNPPSWLLETLDLIGLSSTNIQRLEPGITMVDRLVVPSYPFPSRTETFWLRKQVHDAVDIGTLDSGSYPDRIYISRRNATTRRIQNEDQVISMMSEFDIEPYALETLSVSEQVRLFAGADLIVSPHGAGLANLVYARSPTVLELFGYKQKTTFYRLSKLMGFEYHAMFCDHERRDIHVDMEPFREYLEDMSAGRASPILEPIER